MDIRSPPRNEQNFSLRFTRLLIRWITDSTALAEPSRMAFVESELLVSWLSYGLKLHELLDPDPFLSRVGPKLRRFGFSATTVSGGWPGRIPDSGVAVGRLLRHGRAPCDRVLCRGLRDSHMIHTLQSSSPQSLACGQPSMAQVEWPVSCSGLEGTTRGVMMTPSPECEWGWLPSGQVTCAAGVVHLLPTRPGLSGHIGLGLPRPPAGLRRRPWPACG